MFLRFGRLGTKVGLRGLTAGQPHFFWGCRMFRRPQKVPGSNGAFLVRVSAERWAEYNSRVCFPILFNHRSFRTLAVFPRVSGGFLERRIPGKNGESTPRMVNIPYPQIPIPTKIGSVSDEFTLTPMGSQNGFDHHSHWLDSSPARRWPGALSFGSLSCCWAP